MKITFGICLTLQLFLTITICANQCSYMTRNEIEAHLATKTPYRVLAHKNDKQMIYKGCKPTRIWAIIRHGSRNPSRKVIHRAKDNLMRIREKLLGSNKSKLCPHELAMFRNWSFNIDENDEKNLVYEGEDEMIELAERMQNRFPTLLIRNYDPAVYKFKYTATQRTLKSAESFTTGLFGRHKIRQIVYPEPVYKDPVLRFYKLCSRWRAEVDANPEALVEVKKFMAGKEMTQAVYSVAKKTGIPGLTIDDVHLMYTICAFETAWNKRRMSPWCSLFNEHSIRAMEFREDLEYYWIDGYGYDITHRQACPAISDMINHINPSSQETNATFYFTHSGTLLKLLAHLGLYKDEFILTSEDFNRERKWKVSQIDSFGSNIAFVTYECKDEPKVLVLHQEKIVHITGCPNNRDLCPLGKFNKIFRNSIENCDFNELCKIQDS